MNYKFQFLDDTDKQQIINNNSDKILLEEQHLLEGNFLIFSNIKPLEHQLQDIKNNTDLIILKQEGII